METTTYTSKTKEAVQKYNKSYYKQHQELLKERQRNRPKKSWAKAVQENPEKFLTYSYRHRFGISYEEYLALSENQNHVCAICKKPETQLDKSNKTKRLAVDHCHTTGKIRGLLCMLCNSALGKFNDDVILLEQAITYLKENQ